MLFDSKSYVGDEMMISLLIFAFLFKESFCDDRVYGAPGIPSSGSVPGSNPGGLTPGGFPIGWKTLKKRPNYFKGKNSKFDLYQSL